MYKWTILFFCFVLVLQGCGWEEKKSKKEADTMEYNLFQAVERKDQIAIKNLVKEGVSINTKDSKGRTPLMLATDASIAKF
jgi:ankyrin repeat protein